MTTPNIQDIPEIPDEQIGDGLPRIWWTNGDRKAGTPGYFRFNQDIIDEPLSAPWETKVITFENGNTQPSWVTTKLRLLIVAYRQQAYIADRQQDGRTRKTWLDSKYMEKGAANQSVLTEVLCVIEGVPIPFVWAAPAIKTSMAISANGGIISQIDGLRELARRTWKLKLNRWAFWAPIKTTLDKDGAIVYEKTPGKPVTPPRVYIPKADPLSLWVGDDLYRTVYYDVFNQYADWSKQRRGGVEEPDGTPATDEPQHRNVPEPIDESEPF